MPIEGFGDKGHRAGYRKEGEDVPLMSGKKFPAKAPKNKVPKLDKSQYEEIGDPKVKAQPLKERNVSQKKGEGENLLKPKERP